MSEFKVCPICKVVIASKTVRFSNGSSGTHARLYARVCQYAKESGCINTDPALIGQVTEADGYSMK